VLGSSSTNAFAVTDPATLPLGAYVAGSAATATGCAPGMDGSGYATSCPAGSGSGYGELVPVMGSPEIKPATFGIQSITVGAGGAMTANVSIYVYVVQVSGQDKLKLRARVDGTARTLEATSKVRVVRIAG
jgi:hypothetical protein